MQLAPRPIAAFAVIGALSLLAAGCSAGGDDPTPSPTRNASASASTSPSATSTTTASTDPSPTEAASEPSDDDAPTSFPGTGQTSQPDTDPSDFPATALVTFSGWDAGTKTLQAGGLVSGTTNASGTCTFTAAKGGVTRTQTSRAEASASSVSCAQVSFPAAQVSTGTWSITLKYSVGSQSTTSDPMTAEVP
ncbi:hypothetical protein [Curtobacterium pusillum]|uniref:hypothetical protein n=1 Tax=Curtobacterium pusillum TaxID=69373 RepID=UPI001643C580|nr:hypothetical protein [Curtobacterium pusillum]